MCQTDNFQYRGRSARSSGQDLAGEVDWVLPALLLVGAVTLVRLVLLGLNRTDLFVDEAQYWLWGKTLAFGYFSKPPLIAWVIRAVTTVVHSDAVFWIRMPAALLHGVTAMILGALAARMYGRMAAIWTAVAYVTLPMAAVGSLLISTDTVMAPFFAAALLFYHRLLEEHRLRDAFLVGAMLGFACLAKYAGVYFLLGAVLAGILSPALRPRWGEALAILGVAGALVAPNLAWNLQHGFTTFDQTAHNIGWVQNSNFLSGFDLEDLVEFWVSQVGVAGPVMLGAVLLGIRFWRRQPFLAAFAVVPLAVVSVQSVLDGAFANWAASAYFSGAVLTGAVLYDHPRWQIGSLVVNGAISLILPLLTLFPQLGPEDSPLLHRYLGRAAVSQQILEIAEEAGDLPIVGVSRDVVADLFYTGRDAGLRYYALPPHGKPKSHYSAVFPLPADLTGTVLLVSQTAPACPAVAHPLDVHGTAYHADPLGAYEVDAACARAFQPSHEDQR